MLNFHHVFWPLASILRVVLATKESYEHKHGSALAAKADLADMRVNGTCTRGIGQEQHTEGNLSKISASRTAMRHLGRR